MTRESIQSVVPLPHFFRAHRDAFGRVCTGHARRAARQAGRATGGADYRPSVEDEVDVQLRRRLGHVRLRELALRQSKRARRRRELERPVVRGLHEARAVGELHARVLERSLRQDQRGRRTHLRLDAGRLRAGRLVVRARGSVDRMAVGPGVRGARRERGGCRRRPDAVPAGSRLPALRRRGRGRQPRRLLDERAQGVRVRRDRPLQAGRAHGRSLLSRQRRARRERHRQPVVGRELRVRDRRAHDARRRPT